MPAITYDPDHVARGVARLIERYRKPRTSALLESWLAEVQEVEDALWQLLVERSLADAEGAQLDVLGSIVGQPREGRDDDTYRLWISARNMVLRSSGRTEEMLKIARTLVAATDTIALEEYYPAAFLIRLGGSFTLTLGYQIAYMLRQAKPAGVEFQMTWPASTPTFRFSPDDDPVLDSEHGFDAGRFAVVADGTYNPPVEVGEVPAGALVIAGVPLTIDGAYLVITPPAAAAAAQAPVPAPLVAKPARIVRRAPAALVPAPMPLTGETIELAEAFDDASLEMNDEGTKFRVAESVQMAIAEHDLALETQAEAIIALEDEVAALRFAFALRTTSIGSLEYEEIGILRLDATPFDGALALVAELEVSVAGQTAELQLYDLTAGAAVATISTGATTTTKVTADVTLPLAETLYSLRLRRVGGDSNQRVSCRAAALEVT